MAKKKIDPLNKKHYGAVSVMLTVSDVPEAVSFYQKAFGFTKRGIMNGPDGKPIHAELNLRGTTLMLGPENPGLGKRTAKSLGSSPATRTIPVKAANRANTPIVLRTTSRATVKPSARSPPVSRRAAAEATTAAVTAKPRRIGPRRPRQPRAPGPSPLRS